MEGDLPRGIARPASAGGFALSSPELAPSRTSPQCPSSNSPPLQFFFWADGKLSIIVSFVRQAPRHQEVQRNLQGFTRVTFLAAMANTRNFQ